MGCSAGPKNTTVFNNSKFYFDASMPWANQSAEESARFRRRLDWRDGFEWKCASYSLPHSFWNVACLPIGRGVLIAGRNLAAKVSQRLETGPTTFASKRNSQTREK